MKIQARLDDVAQGSHVRSSVRVLNALWSRGRSRRVGKRESRPLILRLHFKPFPPVCAELLIVLQPFSHSSIVFPILIIVVCVDYELHSWVALSELVKEVNELSVDKD